MTSPARRTPTGPRAAVYLVAAGAAGLILLPTHAVLAGAQAPQEVDARRALARARDAQASFERYRVRRVPVELSGSWGSGCDEILGRMCLRLGEVGDWWPEADDSVLVAARDELLAVLADAAAAAPGDAWIPGQRVAYLGEAGRWDEALAVARACTVLEAGWCRALEGFALHGAGRWVEADRAFARALAAMPEDRARAWRDARPLLDAAGRRHLDRARDEGPEHEAAFLDRLWTLADPLYLVPGNDRETEHLARRVMERVRDDARNPFGMPWGRDLAELLVRYGWERGWQRTFPPPGALEVSGSVIGHHHPYARPYVPPGDALAQPAAAGPDAFNPGARPAARSGYAPPYAPVVLPADGPVAVFPRGDSVLVVGVPELPEDTTYHAAHGHPPLVVSAGLDRGPELEGLFLIPLDGAPMVSVTRPVGAGGGLALQAPAGDYVVSVERWSPELGRAGRLRRGIAVAATPPDVPVLSDLLLADPLGPAEPLQALLPHLLRGDDLRPGDTVRVAWEVHGLGWRAESLEMDLSLERDERGLLRSVGRFLGLVGDPARVDITWSEAGPDRPGPWFRSVLLTLADDLPPGDYVLRLEMRGTGREPVSSSRDLRVGR